MRAVSPSVEAEFGFAEITVVSFADLYAGKLVAALDRQHPRDFFDVRDLFANEGIDDALRRAFIVYLLSHHRPMGEVLASRPKPIGTEYLRGFAGMTAEPVTEAELLAVRARPIKTIVGDMPEAHPGGSSFRSSAANRSGACWAWQVLPSYRLFSGGSKISTSYPRNDVLSWWRSLKSCCLGRPQMGTAKSRHGGTLSRCFKGAVRRQIAADPAFAEALLCEGVATMLGGDFRTSYAVLAEYVKATIDFEALGQGTGHQPAKLVRMFGPRGNPRARVFLGVLAHLQRRAGFRLRVQAYRP